MFSRKPQPQSDLIAIYRLEFYKKQKNWKFNKHRDKTPLKQPEKKLLNITYNIDDCPNEKTDPHNVDKYHNEETSPHNVAFCESDLERNLVSTPPQASPLKRQELSQQWLEQVNIWPTLPQSMKIQPQLPYREIQGSIEESKLNKPKEAWICKRLEILMQAAKLGDLDVQSEPVLAEVPSLDKGEIAQQINASFENDGGFVRDKYWMNFSKDNPTVVWSEPGMVGEGLAGGGWEDADIVDGNFGETPTPLEDWLEDVQDKMCCWTDVDAERSIDSVNEFIRGAHVAPHSSELDLTPTSLTPESCPESLCVLSGSQLATAVRRHTLLLARLMRETARRRKLQNSHILGKYTELNSFEECPTRDVGPESVPHEADGDFIPPTWTRDIFIAGSYRNSVDEYQFGRGRGRLDRPILGGKNRFRD